jgi:hypothetical protein
MAADVDLRLLLEFFQSLFDIALCGPPVLAEEISLRHFDKLFASACNLDLDRSLVQLRGFHFRIREHVLDKARGGITLLIATVSVPAHVRQQGRAFRLHCLVLGLRANACSGILDEACLQKVRSNLMLAPVEQARTAVRETSAERADKAASGPDEKDRTAETSGSIFQRFSSR